jgi:hypothetical protein
MHPSPSVHSVVLVQTLGVSLGGGSFGSGDGGDAVPGDEAAHAVRRRAASVRCTRIFMMPSVDDRLRWAEVQRSLLAWDLLRLLA